MSTDSFDSFYDAIPNYNITGELGKGNYGTVKSAIHKPTGAKVAIKIINLSEADVKNLNSECGNSVYSKRGSISGKKVALDLISCDSFAGSIMGNKNQEILVSDIENEIQIHNSLIHRNIIRLIEVVRSTSHIILVLEYAESNLLELLEKDEDGAQNEFQLKSIFYEIALAVNHCHDNCITHRDIKLDNIQLNQISKIDKSIVKLTDFGLSDFIKDGKFIREDCGSLFYASPEILQDQEYVGTEVDAWSCGVVLYCMLVGGFPFKSKDNDRLCDKIIRGDVKFPSYVSQDSQKLIRGLLNTDPLRRFCMKTVLNHDWFKESEIEAPISIKTSRKAIVSQALITQVKTMHKSFYLIDENIIKSELYRENLQLYQPYNSIKTNHNSVSSNYAISLKRLLKNEELKKKFILWYKILELTHDNDLDNEQYYNYSRWFNRMIETEVQKVNIFQKLNYYYDYKKIFPKIRNCSTCLNAYEYVIQEYLDVNAGKKGDSQSRCDNEGEYPESTPSILDDNKTTRFQYPSAIDTATSNNFKSSTNSLQKQGGNLGSHICSINTITERSNDMMDSILNPDCMPGWFYGGAQLQTNEIMKIVDKILVGLGHLGIRYRIESPNYVINCKKKFLIEEETKKTEVKFDQRIYKIKSENILSGGKSFYIIGFVRSAGDCFLFMDLCGKIVQQILNEIIEEENEQDRVKDLAGKNYIVCERIVDDVLDGMCYAKDVEDFVKEHNDEPLEIVNISN